MWKEFPISDATPCNLYSNWSTLAEHRIPGVSQSWILASWIPFPGQPAWPREPERGVQRCRHRRSPLLKLKLKHKWKAWALWMRVGGATNVHKFNPMICFSLLYCSCSCCCCWHWGCYIPTTTTLRGLCVLYIIYKWSCRYIAAAAAWTCRL